MRRLPDSGRRLLRVRWSLRCRPPSDGLRCGLSHSRHHRVRPASTASVTVAAGEPLGDDPLPKAGAAAGSACPHDMVELVHQRRPDALCCRRAGRINSQDNGIRAVIETAAPPTGNRQPRRVDREDVDRGQSQHVADEFGGFVEACLHRRKVVVGELSRGPMQMKHRRGRHTDSGVLLSTDSSASDDSGVNQTADNGGTVTTAEHG